MTRRPGFTLLEMLVAMTLIAFIMVAGQQVIALAARAAAPRGDGGHGFLVQRQIADWLETALPVRSDRRDRAPLIFSGDQGSLRFVTVLPQRFGLAGPNVVTMSGSPGGLLARWQPLRLTGEQQVGERLILEGAVQVSFRYWDNAGGWRNAWPAGQRLPDLIELSMSGGPAEGWPPIVVAPRNR
ncbi:prepilin-type N-terminal cleavage/methylation domain-containing protein [Skermanella pratensis]|uniref:prepilin-type N-terminal cleavage/methylation domain-containing protein n=1 Tax=Skermanella pratensis TaxID=2233999 RepID=UPI0013018EC2|nr:prepilin-type N-terminal cleavage/methylation domain-containing protein [Skermanella pratensis]